MNHQLSLDEKDLTAVKEFHKKISQKLQNNLLKVALFGSKVTGKATEDSDIDLLILVKYLDTRLKDEIFDVAYEVNLEHGVYISPRVIDVATFNDPLWSSTPFFHGLRQQSVPL